MPSAHKHRRAKGTRITASDSSKKHSRSAANKASSNANALGAEAATGEGNARLQSEKTSKGVPAPAGVLMRALGLSAEVTDGTGEKGECDLALLTSSLGCDPSRSMEVEVETSQGYVYTGKLVHIDARYNIMLNEALVRRARGFDVERAALREKLQRESRLLATSLQGVVAQDADVVESTSELMPRPRYIGATYIRSNNIFLMRFIDTAACTGGTAASVSSSNSALGKLKSNFSMMAASIKAHLQREKMRNRAARRKRLEAKKVVKGGGGDNR
ncbi:hypothetical protein, conserved [Leishmania tarentolae]|uniref:LSM domain-containing protein n=1 Tax=Leishmania tarentolae TaxID=5689 RepID=A0A640KER5_LEITA|nr:hypothetical protein, conserved [Leishmania tarentolae]